MVDLCSPLGGISRTLSFTSAGLSISAMITVGFTVVVVEVNVARCGLAGIIDGSPNSEYKAAKAARRNAKPDKATGLAVHGKHEYERK